MVLAWLIFENVYKSLADNDDFMKLAATILIQAKLNFENVCESLGNNDSFYKKGWKFITFQRELMRILRRESRKRGHNNKKRSLSIIALI